MPRIAVSVGVLEGADGRLLLSRRHPEAHQGGRWEFPGGKIEPNETPEQALAREFEEELGLKIHQCEPLISIPFDYPTVHVRLHVFKVTRATGIPRGCEQQAIDWFDRDQLASLDLPEANRGIVTALRLPDRYLITPEPEEREARFLAGLEASLDTGISLVQFRAKTLPTLEFSRLAEKVMRLCQRQSARLLINGPIELACSIGADGVHLTAAALQALSPEDRPRSLWVAASCHTGAELASASILGVDFAVCSPVCPTQTHPDQRALGWGSWAALCRGAPFPVYALGGMRLEDIGQARKMGGQGIAAIRGLWQSG